MERLLLKQSIHNTKTIDLPQSLQVMRREATDL